LVNCNDHAKTNISQPHSPTPSALCTAPTGCSGKTKWFSRSEYTRARLRYFLFPVPNLHMEFVIFLRSSLPALFLPRASHLLAASSRELVHMQASQCGNQMGTKFWWWCATSTASAAAASTVATRMRSSAT
jgi:hypothetical protein